MKLSALEADYFNTSYCLYSYACNIVMANLECNFPLSIFQLFPFLSSEFPRVHDLDPVEMPS